MGIQKIHRDCFEYLIENYRKNGIMFMVRQKNNQDRLLNKYFFTGNKKYVAISFWNGADPDRHIYKIAYIILNTGESYIQMTSKEDEKCAKGLKNLIEIIEKKLNYKFKEIRKNEWRYSYRGESYLGTLKKFMLEEKQIIDKYIKSNQDICVDFIDNDKFDKMIGKLFKYLLIKETEEEKLKETKTTLVNIDSSYKMEKFHNIFQNEIYQFLKRSKIYKKVILEKNYVDIVGQNYDGTVDFYELKIGEPKKGIRAALGQLLEYAHYPNKEKAKNLIIITDRNPKDEDIQYINFLREKYSLKVYLQYFDMSRKELMTFSI